jgi:Bacterial sugar transferase
MVEPDFYSGASDEQRLSCFGAWLRRTSLDELPELWNVLRGELSPVGSRPLLMQYVDRYPPEQSRRHEVLPRVTGWPQLHGRNATTWEQRFALDIWNVDHLCFWLDLKILALTIVKVLKREGISHAGHATMPEPAKRSTRHFEQSSFASTPFSYRPLTCSTNPRLLHSRPSYERKVQQSYRRQLQRLGEAKQSAQSRGILQRRCNQLPVLSGIGL